MVRVGINGLGIMGRYLIRAIKEQKRAMKIVQGDVEVVAFNDLFPAEQLEPLLQHDSVYGRFYGTVKADGKDLIIDGERLDGSDEKDPSKLRWEDRGVDVVYESTGRFADNRKALEAHLKAGAKRVVISAPSNLDIPTIVMGVNDLDYNNEPIVSNASCTTNCLAPLADALLNTFGNYRGLMTTIHAYTADQRLVDAPHKDVARAYAAAENMVPTTTGAAKAIGRVVESLDKKLDGVAIRVPLAIVSLVDLTAVLDSVEAVTAEKVNEKIKLQAYRLQGILDCRKGPLVSSMIKGDPIPCIFDASQTRTVGNLVKVFAWYDNVAGYSHQAVGLIKHIGEGL